LVYYDTLSLYDFEISFSNSGLFGYSGGFTYTMSLFEICLQGIFDIWQRMSVIHIVNSKQKSYVLYPNSCARKRKINSISNKCQLLFHARHDQLYNRSELLLKKNVGVALKFKFYYLQKLSVISNKQ
jgi:hypothetical protein